MCGFLASINKNGFCKDNINKGLKLLRHRGPNDSGYEVYPIAKSNVLLGHTRLSIIDLSDAGHQPFWSACKQYCIAYNGEVYNYKELRNELKGLGVIFKTDSDTEVVLLSWMYWGENSLKKFIGMFSFVIMDKQKEEIFGARDAFGIKPFFYTQSNGVFSAASELPALLAVNGNEGKLNLQRSYDYLVHGDYDSTNESFLEGINKVPAGCFFKHKIQSQEKINIIKWWEPSTETTWNKGYSKAVLAVRETFLNSVGLHMRSDVEFGAALSGGVDSSAIVCAMKHINPDLKINTFSYIADDHSLSEEVWVDGINKEVESKAHKVYTNSQSLMDDLDNMLMAQGEPFGGTSIYAQYNVFKLAHEKGVKVVLEGQGADELLAGYIGYPGQRILSIIEKKGFFSAHSYIKKWANYPGRSYFLGIQYFIQLLLRGKVYSIVRKMMGNNFQPLWLRNEVLKGKNVSLTENRIVLNKKNKGNRVKEALVNSLQHRGLASLLRHGDRNSMAFSVESRVPFLTIPMAELLLSLPEEYLISDDGVTKNIFRDAMRGIVPDEHLDRKDKVGFSTPEKN
mgnify:CR=1 FL=1